MLEQLKQRVCEANLELARRGLVVGTFGNVSGIDEERKHVVIKPSGVPYERMGPDDMVVVSAASGEVLEGKLNPSSDTPTHLEIYRAFGHVGGVVHTHSIYATAWAQARREIPPLGTTHADAFHGAIPCTRIATDEEVGTDYERNIGRLIVERFADIDPSAFPGVLVAAHGPFAWGETPAAAVEAAFTVEHLAQLASETLRINPDTPPLPQALLDRHFLRKHGPDASYGQDKR